MATLDKDNEAQSYIKDNFSYFPNGEGGMKTNMGINTNEAATGEGDQATAATDGPVAGTLEYNKAAALKPLEKQKDIYQRMMDSMRRPETEEEKAKREKKENSRRVIGAVSDGLRALGNLFFTSQYAPDMYKGSTRQLDKTNEWIERAKTERDKNDTAYYNLALKIGDKEAEMAKTVRDLEAQQEARKLAKDEADRKARELAMKEEEHTFRIRGAEADANKKESDAEYSRVKAENAPEEFRLKNETERLRGEELTSRTVKNNAQAGAANRSHRENEYYYDGKTYLNYDNLEKQVNKDIADYKDRHVKRDSEGKPVYKKKEVPNYVNGVQQGTKLIEDTENYEYDDTYIPIDSGYWEGTANDRRWNYYDARDNAAKIERILEKERRGQGNQGKKKANPMGEAPKPNNGKKANPMN